MKAAMSGARGPAFRATQKTAKPNMHLESVVWGGECPLLVAWRCHTIPAILLILSLLVVGCSGIDRSPPEPANLTDQSTVLGIPNARFYADTQAAAMAQEALRAVERERAAVRPGAAGLEGRLPSADLLAISGGSDDGAFGAGLLVGWTDAGTRPEFKLVSGVSTGALIAPFAFLGSAYDSQLRAIYTGVQPADIYEKRLILTAVFHESFADTAPLFALISRHFNEEMMAAIAREYGKGRLLLIGTTNLDSQRPVIWNIGAIAASGRPGAIELVRKILLASASVPGLFPPVLKAVGRERHAFLIRNSRLDPDWASVERSLFSITGRAISTMIHYSGYNDVLRIYATTQRDGVDYNLAFIGPDFNAEHKEPFDQPYMRALFDYGYQRGRAGYSWRKAPPLLDTTTKP